MNISVNSVGSAVFEDGEIVISMTSGVQIRFPIRGNPRLAHATPSQLNNIEVSPFGLHWPELDEDLSLEGLLSGNYGQDGKRQTAA